MAKRRRSAMDVDERAGKRRSRGDVVQERARARSTLYPGSMDTVSTDMNTHFVQQRMGALGKRTQRDDQEQDVDFEARVKRLAISSRSPSPPDYGIRTDILPSELMQPLPEWGQYAKINNELRACHFLREQRKNAHNFQRYRDTHSSDHERPSL